MALQFVTVVLLAGFIYLLIKYQSVKKKMILETSVMLHECKRLSRRPLSLLAGQRLLFESTGENPKS